MFFELGGIADGKIQDFKCKEVEQDSDWRKIENNRYNLVY